MNSGLKLCLCLVCTLFFAVPYVHADSYTPTFDCSRGCNAAPPTAPDVTFPSPTLMVLFGGVTWDFTLPAVDLPGDTYLWGMFDSCIGDSCVDTFVIVDVTTNETEQSAVDTTTAPFGAGQLNATAPRFCCLMRRRISFCGAFTFSPTNSTCLVCSIKAEVKKKISPL